MGLNKVGSNVVPRYPHRLGLAQIAQALDLPAPRAKPEPEPQRQYPEPVAPTQRHGVSHPARPDILVSGVLVSYERFAACEFSPDAPSLAEQLGLASERAA